MKRIRLTIEWAGACSEPTWASVLSEAIEKFDMSGLTRVSDVELLTDFRDTPPLTLAPLPPKPPPNRWCKHMLDPHPFDIVTGNVRVDREIARQRGFYPRPWWWRLRRWWRA